MKVSSFIGVDISKNTLDVAICQEATPEKYSHQQFNNTLAGCKKMLNWLKNQSSDLSKSYFTIEHTGWYTLLLCSFLQEEQLAFGLYAPLHLKRSLGLTRGKTDKIDAQRLAYYAFSHRHALKLTLLPSATLLKAKNLFAFRDRLVKTQSSLKVTITDLKATAKLIDNKFIIRESEKQLRLIEQQVKHTEKQLEATIQEDEEMKKHFHLLRSVPGIGLVTAAALILATNNFTAFTDSRKFASYCGAAPFEHQSGTSYQGKTRISQYANKRIKALLTNGANSAIQHDEEIKAYYQRKIAEGKHKMVVINAIRVKLINRAFATINRGTEFVKIRHYPQAA
ncbi:MAG: IS110 family transposase [Bacteroidota bacterium]